MDKSQLETLFSNLKESIDLISIDKKELNKWKKEKRNLFLQFAPSLKDVISQFNLYINDIESELNTEYTSEISQEIIKIKSDTEKKLSSENTGLKPSDVNDISDETIIEDYQNYESDKILEIIENGLEELKSRETKWEDKKEDIIKRISEDKNNLIITENEIKSILAELAEQRNLYLANKKILEIHFQNNQNILSFKSSIEDDINTINDKLKDLDDKLKVLLLREQEIVERSINKPYTFE